MLGFGTMEIPIEQFEFWALMAIAAVMIMMSAIDWTYNRKLKKLEKEKEMSYKAQDQNLRNEIANSVIRMIADNAEIEGERKKSKEQYQLAISWIDKIYPYKKEEMEWKKKIEKKIKNLE